MRARIYGRNARPRVDDQRAGVCPARLLWLRAARIAREPAALHALALVEDFLDGPERGEAGHARQRRPQRVGQPCRQRRQHHAQHQEPPPAAHAEVVLTLNHHRVKQPDNQERAQANHRPQKMILR